MQNSRAVLYLLGIRYKLQTNHKNNTGADLMSSAGASLNATPIFPHHHNPHYRPPFPRQTTPLFIITVITALAPIFPTAAEIGIPATPFLNVDERHNLFRLRREVFSHCDFD